MHHLAASNSRGDADVVQRGEKQVHLPQDLVQPRCCLPSIYIRGSLYDRHGECECACACAGCIGRATVVNMLKGATEVTEPSWSRYPYTHVDVLGPSICPLQLELETLE